MKPSAYLAALLESLRRAGWFPVTVLVVHLICVHVLDLYTIWPPIDIPMHFLGGMSIAYFASAFLTALQRHNPAVRLDPFLHCTVSVCAACTTAVLWEFAEWTSDNLFGSSAQGGRNDTMLDLVLGGAGATLFALPKLWLLAKQHRTDNSEDPQQ